MRRTLDISVAVAVTFEHDDETGAHRIVGIVLDDSAAVFGDDYCAYVQEGPEAGEYLDKRTMNEMRGGLAVLMAADAAIGRAQERFNGALERTGENERWITPAEPVKRNR